MTDQVEFGLGKGKVFPHQKARSLLHPVRRLIQSPQALVRWIGLRGDETVLELGCGPGYFSIALRDATPHGRLVLFDLQPEMLSMAVERTGIRSGLAAVTGNAVALTPPQAVSSPRLDRLCREAGLRLLRRRRGRLRWTCVAEFAPD